jgi:hypothetical protein
MGAAMLWPTSTNGLSTRVNDGGQVGSEPVEGEWPSRPAALSETGEVQPDDLENQTPSVLQ